MSSYVIGDESGFPKRCFTWRSGGDSKDSVRKSHTFCIVWLQLPTFLWRGVIPDPGPELSIAGVEPELLRELELVDMMSWLATKGRPELAAAFKPLAAERLMEIQRKLPEGLSFAMGQDA